jgi:hypothetical protein
MHLADRYYPIYTSQRRLLRQGRFAPSVGNRHPHRLRHSIE